MRTIATLSKLDSRCEKCKHKDNCDNKRMVACSLAEIPKTTMKNATMPNTVPVTQTLSREHTSIVINMGEYGNINTSIEQIAKQINKALQNKLCF